MQIVTRWTAGIMDRLEERTRVTGYTHIVSAKPEEEWVSFNYKTGKLLLAGRSWHESRCTNDEIFLFVSEGDFFEWVLRPFKESRMFNDS